VTTTIGGGDDAARKDILLGGSVGLMVVAAQHQSLFHFVADGPLSAEQACPCPALPIHRRPPAPHRPRGQQIDWRDPPDRVRFWSTALDH
jgi:hypothetical protein